MKKVMIAAACLAAVAVVPVRAQHMGSDNANAPSVVSSLTWAKTRRAEEATLEIKYAAIRWGSGNTMNALSDVQRGASRRKALNASAPNSPLGDFKTNIDLVVGEKAVAAGAYKVYFTIDDAAKWHVNFAKDGAVIEWPLDLKEAGSEQGRLGLTLTAGEKSRTADLNVRFGKLAGSLAVAKAPAPKPAEGGEKSEPPKKDG